MLDRRRFTFGALLAVGVASATEAVASEAETLPVSARFAASHRGKVLTVELWVRNATPEAIDVLMAVGSRNGPTLRAHRVGAPEDEDLAEIVEIDRRELMSRRGPAPLWLRLSDEGEALVGTYRFATPEGAPSEVTLAVSVQTRDGLHDLPEQVVSLGRAAT